MDDFTGFSPADFDVFLIPEFHDRMAALRRIIRPKLAILGDLLAPKISEVVGHPLYPHTASHARRRVNPPDDTWVAFSRSGRGYKKYAHFEVGIALEYVFVRFVVKPEGEVDKPGLLNYLDRQSVKAFQLVDTDPIYWYRDDHGVDPQPLADVTPDSAAALIDHARLKSHGFTVGVTLARDNPVVATPALSARCLSVITHLAPLYLGTVSQDRVSV